MATSFTVNKADLEFMLRQIKIAEATSLGYTSAPKSILQSIMDAQGVTAAVASQLPFGLRTVDGSYNSLLTTPGQSEIGAADNLFPRLTDPVFRNETDGDSIDFDGPALGSQPPVVQGNYGAPGTVIDADPRIISNLIVDMSVRNPAAIETFLNNPLAVAAFEEEHGFAPTKEWLIDPANVTAANEALHTIPNQSPDIGLSPGFNAWMTFFGQFFDHGLDLVTKGGNQTVYIPLQADDPLIAGPDGIFGNADDLAPQLRFMALTRATPTVINGVPQHENTTTSFVDQNQTYTSHASHQVFLREYATVAGKTVATGRLLDGAVVTGSVAGAIGNWADVKAQALQYLGINLSDHDVNNVPLLLTDQYGKFIPGANGYAQIVMAPDATHATLWYKEGNPDGSVTTAGSIGTNHAFLNDIQHHAAPGFVDTNHNGVRDAGEALQTADLDPGIGDDGNPNTYDDEALNLHFVTGDGRGNENTALTVVHSIFHSEHNRLVDVNKATILASNDLAFINEWLATDLTALPTAGQALNWDGERLFQAARFATEMQYQHMVFEEFARRVQPMVDPFIFNSSPNVDPSIVAEFAHTVYRFGHSMLTGTVDRLDNNLELLNGEPDQQTLLAMFLNPTAYVESGATIEEINANFIRGLSRDVGNAIDEFIVTDVRSNLLGLPLDLGALNIARGRDTGIPSLNETRAQLYNDTGLADLKPYSSWYDFALNIKNVASVVNFIAAYGTHATLTAPGITVAQQRAAAELLVFGGTGAPADRLDFLHGRGAYGQTVNPTNSNDLRGLGGLNDIDLWIGGLAEKSPEFGGMLGTTFNFVFEYQMEALQNGDRLYYLTRTQGTNFLNNLEPNSFSDIVMRNTALGDQYSTHLNGQLFVTPDHIIELDRGIAQADYNGAAAGSDPLWDGSNPVLEAILGPKVARDYTGSTVIDGTHDFGGTLRVQGGEHYVLGGTEGADKIWGDSGIDTLWGDGGNDYLNGMTESDDVFGGEGDDVIEDPFGDDVLRGNQGNDVLTSARGADLMFGDQGQDYILLGQDAAEAFGGEGTDFILGGNGKDFILGNEGDDWIEGGGGFDTIAGENSELFFNSPIIGHDVMFGQGDEHDYDAESGDDIMGSGPSVFRYEGMFGFDWGIAKFDESAIAFDLQIPIFTTIPNDVLRDRFDQVEALSGWKNGDVLDGDDRGHSGGSSSPDSTPVELFVDHTLDQAGIDRIAGLGRLLSGNGPAVSSFKNGNVLIGGDGNDMLRGRGGFDTIDGDAWLNVRIKIVIPSGQPNAGTYSAESMTTDTAFAGPNAGKVFNVYTAADQAADSTHIAGAPNFASPAFGGRSLNSLLLDRTINPGQMSIVREILYDDTAVTGPNKNIDTAIFQGGDLEYEIEGTRIVYDATTGEALRRVNIGQGDNSTQPLNIRDVNGDGFITVRDLDDGLVAAPGRVGGLTVSRGALTDDTDKLVNIERLQFADKTLTVGLATASNNTLATGMVTISDPSPFDHDNNPATPGVVSPIVGQVLTATLSNLVDPDGVPLDSSGNPIGLTFEWQTTEAGNDGGWATISTGLTYTVRPVDPAHVLRAVAVFQDSKGVTERIASGQTDNVTAPFSINENTASGTVIAPVPFSLDYDPLGFGGTGVTDGDVVQLTHVISPGQDAGGRFTIVNTGTAALPVYQLAVANGGPQMLNYEAPVHTPANQSHQFVDNQYQILIDTYTDTIANGGVLMAQRQFTILLNDVTGEVVNIAPTLDLNADATTTTPTPFPQAYRDTFVTVAYNNSNGTSSWATSWTESGDDGSAATGEIAISGGQLRFTQTSDNNDSVARAINGLPLDVSAATLSFDYQSVGLDNLNLPFGDRERIIVEVRNTTSGGWTEIGALGGTTTGTFSQPINPSLLGANTQIRFRVDTSAILGNSSFETGESFSIDNVNVAITRSIVTTVSGTPGNDYTAASYTEGGPGVAIASNPTGADVDNALLMGATVRLTNAQPGDLLSIQGTLPTGMTMIVGPAVAGVITMYLSGNGPISKAALQTAIAQVRFSNTGDNPNPTSASTPRTIAVTVNDGVAESLIATATVNVLGVDDPFVARADRIVTNIANANFVVPEWVLLANDGDPDTSGVVGDITNVTENSSGFTATLIATGVQINDQDGSNNTFTYTANLGTTASVAVVRDTNNVDGGTGDDILVGDGDGDTFDGGTGNDFVFAGAGDDTIVWNANTTGATDGRDYVDGQGNSNPATTGSMVVTGNGGATGNRLNFTENTDGTESITRAVDLTGAASATLSFTWRVDDVDAGENLLVQAFNGTTWDIIGTLDGNATEDTDFNFSVALTVAQRGAHAAIRLVSPDLGAGENFYIDAVTITTPTGTFVDTFGAQAHNNTNGTRPWSTSWVEANDLVNAVDTFVVNGNDTVEDFKVYARADAISAGFTDLKADTEIVITRNGIVIAELDNIEEITINTAGGNDTVAAIGNFNPTSLNFNTITIEGGTGNDSIDITSLASAHRILFRSNGGNDTIIGNLRPQDVIELPAGAVAADYTTTTDENGVSTMTSGTHTVTFTAPVGMPQVGNDVEEDDEDTAGNDDDNDNGGEDDRPGNSPVTGGLRTGTPQADVLLGTTSDDNIIALAGDDVAMGDAGADNISAGEGGDFVNGGDGRDTIFAGTGDDQVFAGAGADIVYGDAGADRIFGDQGNDMITAGAGDDTVFGGAGDDMIIAEAGDGNDVYFGDEGGGVTGIDTLDMSAITANVTVNLGAGPLSNGTTSSLQSGNDTIWGIENVNTGSGKDTITASNAVNVMNGGANDDIFKFTSAAAADGDTIVGFEPGDRIDLTAIDANVGTANDQSFTLVTGAPLAAGDLGVTHETRDGEQFTVVQGNIDGGAADFKIEIAGHHNLTASNLGL